MKPKKPPKVDELLERRNDILGIFSEVKTKYVRELLGRRLDSINRDLYTITKNPIYK